MTTKAEPCLAETESTILAAQDHFAECVPDAPVLQTAVLDGKDAAIHAKAIAALQGAPPPVQGAQNIFWTRLLLHREAVSAGHSSEITPFELFFDDAEAIHAPSRAAAKGGSGAHFFFETLETALADIAKNGHDAFSVGLIRNLHRAVMALEQEQDPSSGSFRKAAAPQGPFAPQALIGLCLTQQIDFLHGDTERNPEDAITRLAIGYTHFTAVKPFQAGNGRTGRLLWPLMLAAQGLPPLCLSVHLKEHEEDYRLAMTRAFQGEYQALIAVLSGAIVDTLDFMQQTEKELQRLDGLWRDRAYWRKNSAAERILDYLPDHPLITAGQLSAILDVSIPSANAAMKQLIAADVLREQTGGKRNRVFVSWEVIDLLRKSGASVQRWAQATAPEQNGRPAHKAASA